MVDANVDFYTGEKRTQTSEPYYGQKQDSQVACLVSTAVMCMEQRLQLLKVIAVSHQVVVLFPVGKEGARLSIGMFTLL